MVVFVSVCADLSSEFLQAVPGPIERKLVTLQSQLGEHFPRITLQCLCSDNENIVQVKGCLKDITAIHEAFETWMQNELSTAECDIDLQKNKESNEKIDHITNGIFYDNEEFEIEPKDEETSSKSAEINFPDLEENPGKDESNVSEENRQECIDAEEPNHQSHQEETIKPTATRSGRIVKPPKHSMESEGSDNSEKDTDGFVEEGNDYDGPVVKVEKRGRKKKALETINPDEVDVYLELCEDSSQCENNVMCLMCGYKTNAKRHLKAHLLRCHVQAEHACKLCKRKYALEKDLRAHMKTHFPKHKCVKCSRKFPTSTVLEIHKQRFHNRTKEERRLIKLGQLIFKCEHCDYTAESEKSLNDHIGRHHSDRKFHCDMCNKSYGLKKDLVAHKRIHSGEFECSECGKVLGSKHALKMHVDVIHKGLKNTHYKSYVCDYCGIMCKSKTHYKEHVNKEHLNVRPYGCPLCTVAFFSNASLKSHLMTHTDSRDFKCKTCGKAFKALSSLRTHEITHLDYSQRPYVCDECSKSFSQKGALVRHKRIHSGEKPYKCRLCESAFSDYSILRRHMLGVHKLNSRDLCQREDAPYNKGGGKSDRVIVDDITPLRRLVREPSQSEDETKTVYLTANDLQTLKAQTSSRLEEVKLDDSLTLQITNDDKINLSSLDANNGTNSETNAIDTGLRYVIQDGTIVRAESTLGDGFDVSAESLMNSGADVSCDGSLASQVYTVSNILPSTGSEDELPIVSQVLTDITLNNMTYTVQHITTGDGHNIPIQIL